MWLAKPTCTLSLCCTAGARSRPVHKDSVVARPHSAAAGPAHLHVQYIFVAQRRARGQHLAQHDHLLPRGLGLPVVQPAQGEGGPQQLRKRQRRCGVSHGPPCVTMGNALVGGWPGSPGPCQAAASSCASAVMRARRRGRPPVEQLHGGFAYVIGAVLGLAHWGRGEEVGQRGRWGPGWQPGSTSRQLLTIGAACRPSRPCPLAYAFFGPTSRYGSLQAMKTRPLTIK